MRRSGPRSSACWPSRFALAPAAVQALFDEAEAAVRHSTQFFPFTQQICRQLDPEARVRIIEMLWEVAYADGVLDPQEDMLLRRIAGLIYVSDGERGAARKRALERLATAPRDEDTKDCRCTGHCALPQAPYCSSGIRSYSASSLTRYIAFLRCSFS